jgi:hypothetical protein
MNQSKILPIGGDDSRTQEEAAFNKMCLRVAREHKTGANQPIF